MSQPEELEVESAVRSAPVTVFVSDPTAEAERVAQAMRAAGYTVVDVPLSMLVARVAVQHPRVILVDADGEGALDVIARMRELPDAEDIHVLLLAMPGGAVGSEEEALAHEASGLFVRPVDVPELVSRVSALAGHEPSRSRRGGDRATPRHRPSVPPSRPPVSTRAPFSVDPPAPVEPPLSRRPPALSPPVSVELRRLLADAERRVTFDAEPDGAVPTPEDELEAILPAELLAALDEPLEEEDDDEVVPMGRHAASAAARDEPGPDGPPAPITNGGTHSGATGTGPATGGGSQGGAASAAAAAVPEPLPPSMPPPTAWSPMQDVVAPSAVEPYDPAYAPPFPAVVVQGETLRVLARAIAGHETGSLCFSSQGADRRVVLREGDIVTAVSSSDDESLLAFLTTRGDLPRETIRRLAATFPLFGRHAGAALVARGYLRQDQLWTTLRAHAEWVLARALQTDGARLVVEPQPPGRLQGEPSVFGGSPGAAVLVDVVRRVVAPEGAVQRLGGLGARIGPGHGARLLTECGLAPVELAQVQSANGRTLDEALGAAPDGDLATVLLALSELGVVEVLRSVATRAASDEQDAFGIDALDAEAIRERVRARMQIVDDGDYFALLGVTRDATGYEVRRAFLDLRRAFEPARVLTPETADLADDLRKITFVLEEAYDILKDGARRERYRRAIEAVPER